MKVDFKVSSSDKIHTLAGVVYLPSGEAKGYFHIVHGMTEHIGRYERIMSELAEEGYICFGYDNLGHGNTALNDGELGYIAKKGGDDLLCRDVSVFSDAVIEEYGKKYGRLPYYLMGHSMGSFITRLAVERYVKPDKYIIMGTGGKNPAAGAGLALIAIIKLFFGDRHISRFIDKMAFGSYNKRFSKADESDSSPWLTRDESVRRKYYADKYCSFKFTLSAMADLIRLMKKSNRSAWYKNIDKNLSILLLSGAQDPVGNYGKGVEEVKDSLLRQGCNAKTVIYPDARHEILNDSTYEQVKTDILKFLD